VPAASRTTSRAKAKATAAAAALKPVPASPVIDDFVLHSDGDDEFVAHSDDEGEMHEVEADLQVSVRSGGASLSHIWLYYVIISPCVDARGMHYRTTCGRSDAEYS
jgi:hypothetical protein